jgi:hypothetical protein
MSSIQPSHIIIQEAKASLLNPSRPFTPAPKRSRSLHPSTTKLEPLVRADSFLQVQYMLMIESSSFDYHGFLQKWNQTQALHVKESASSLIKLFASTSIISKIAAAVLFLIIQPDSHLSKQALQALAEASETLESDTLFLSFFVIGKMKELSNHRCFI